MRMGWDGWDVVGLGWGGCIRGGRWGKGRVGYGRVGE